MELIAFGMYSIEKVNAFDWVTGAKDTSHNATQNPHWTFFLCWHRFSVDPGVPETLLHFDEILGKFTRDKLATRFAIDA